MIYTYILCVSKPTQPPILHVVDLLSTQPSPSQHLPLHVGELPVEGMEDLRSSPVMVMMAVCLPRDGYI